MLDINIEKMKQAALAATQGEWKFIDVVGACSVHAGQRQVLRYSYSPDSENRANAEHIATANPSGVLELITRLEAAEAASKFWESHANDLATQDNKLIAEMTQQAIEAEAAITNLLENLEAAELEFKQCSQLLDDAHRSLEAAEQDAARWKALVAEAERDYVEVALNAEPYYQRFECTAAMEEFADAAMKESK